MELLSRSGAMGEPQRFCRPAGFYAVRNTSIISIDAIGICR